MKWIGAKLSKDKPLKIDQNARIVASESKDKDVSSLKRPITRKKLQKILTPNMNIIG